MEILKGISLLLGVLGLFAVFSLYAPKGQKTMNGLANAAMATFLVEAVLKYVLGDAVGIEFFKEVGSIIGEMGGVVATSFIMINLGVSPVLALASGASMYNFGVLEGFIAGYLLSFLAPFFEKKLPVGVGDILGVLVFASLSYSIGKISHPLFHSILLSLGDMISEASNQSPLLMGIVLGGLMKMICTSPLSSMALTAIIGLKGLPMGIASIACFGGAFANGITFLRLKLGNKSNIVSVILEPLTQADIVTLNPIPVFFGSFMGGALAGIPAVYFNIINNAPGTASPVPGILVSFGFNDPSNVLFAGVLAIIGGIIGGFISTTIVLKLKLKIKRV